MKTGQGEMDMSSFIDTAMDLVMEMITKSTVLAGYYVKACGRNTLTALDLNYCMKYSSMFFKPTPEFLDQFGFSDDEDEDIDIETVGEDDEPFVRYVGENKTMNNINEAYDTWNTWKPTSQLQKRFKDAVDNIDTNELICGISQED